MFAERAADGSMRYNVGNYHLANGYGGVRLERIRNERGSTLDVFNQGYMTRRELRNCMWAWIEGHHTGKESAKRLGAFTAESYECGMADGTTEAGWSVKCGDDTICDVRTSDEANRVAALLNA